MAGSNSALLGLPLGMPTFGANPQLELRLTGGGGRFFIFAESVGVHQDGRLQEGLQQAEFPSIGVALHCASPALTQQVEAAPRDGVVLQCALEPSDAPYVISRGATALTHSAFSRTLPAGWIHCLFLVLPNLRSTRHSYLHAQKVFVAPPNKSQNVM